MSDEALQLLKKSGVLKEGHFLLASGLHSPVYWEKFRLLQYPQYTGRLCGLIAQHFCDCGVSVVAGPTTGGIILAFETARQLGVRDIFAEKEGERRLFRRDFELSPGERTLVVDDVLTTGGSVMETLEAVRDAGAVPVGVGVLVNRSQGEIDFGVPLFACVDAPALVYAPEYCPQCRAGVPLTKPGAAR